MKNITCCFTGHRPNKIFGYDLPNPKYQNMAKVIKYYAKMLYLNYGVKRFITGGALGFDTLAAQTVLELKKDYKHIRLILVLPCENQTRGWKEKDVETYEELKQQADKVVYTSKEYTRGCMHKRNRYLVDNSSVCVCYLTEDTGGTAYTVNYAIKSGLKVINTAK